MERQPGVTEDPFRNELRFYSMVGVKIVNMPDLANGDTWLLAANQVKNALDPWVGGH